eukprot:TRINITY_DN4309_c0_g1_i5.p1 TRINITY_DN4309_c0_g1~~TRINITY_DN4309_c0_g1_i5.p1  ORF type:complete len:308 (+),score=32.09 TRINITY_DN4309_c0_g1_i5:134-925(+)
MLFFCEDNGFNIQRSCDCEVRTAKDPSTVSEMSPSSASPSEIADVVEGVQVCNYLRQNSNRGLRGIIGEDNRLVVEDNECFPHSSIGAVDAYGVQCTGFMVSQDVLLTMGFCLGMLEEETDISFLPGFGFAENQSVNVSYFEIVETGVQSMSLAVVKLQEAIGNETGWLELSDAPVDDDSNVYLIGYSAPTLVRQECQFEGFLNEVEVYHNCDTSNGMSGAPILKESTLNVVAIHAKGFSELNGALLLNPDLSANLKQKIDSM